MATVGWASLAKCFRICNSTSIALSTLQRFIFQFFYLLYSESDKRGIIITSKKPPKIGGDGLPPDVVKTDIQINPGSFETNRNQLVQVTREDGSKVTRIGKTVVGGREAYRIWSSYFGANSISTLIRYTDNETVSVSSYYSSQNSSALGLIQSIHGSFRSQR